MKLLAIATALCAAVSGAAATLTYSLTYDDHYWGVGGGSTFDTHESGTWTNESGSTRHLWTRYAVDSWQYFSAAQAYCDDAGNPFYRSQNATNDASGSFQLNDAATYEIRYELRDAHFWLSTPTDTLFGLTVTGPHGFSITKNLTDGQSASGLLHVTDSQGMFTFTSYAYPSTNSTYPFANWATTYVYFSVRLVPEPASLSVLALGALTFLIRRRR